MIDLDGLRVLVTGGNRGIGAACSRFFAESGAAVCIHYRAREDAATSVLDRLRSLSSQPHFKVAADLAEPEGCGSTLRICGIDLGATRLSGQQCRDLDRESVSRS